MLFIVCIIIVIWFVILALKPEKDKNANSNNVEQKRTYLTPEKIEKYYEESKEISKRQEYNDSDYYDSSYDIDFEDDTFCRTEKIYAIHEEASEELDDYYDEEYDLNSGLYESEQDSYEDFYDSDDNADMNNYDNFDEEKSGDYF